MTKEGLRYDRMVERAMRGVVRDALSYAAANGLPGTHHFYITFKTAAPGVEIGDQFREKYPDDMTIVLEHEFWELTVSETAFAVTLSFNRRPERLSIPFAAVTAFADPSVKFGLQFEEAPASEDPPQSGGDQPLRLAEAPEPASASRSRKERATPKLVEEKPADESKSAHGQAGAKKPGEVVTLDTFRKK
jgi:hypothetical protein